MYVSKGLGLSTRSVKRETPAKAKLKTPPFPGFMRYANRYIVPPTAIPSLGQNQFIGDVFGITRAAGTPEEFVPQKNCICAGSGLPPFKRATVLLTSTVPS